MSTRGIASILVLSGVVLMVVLRSPIPVVVGWLVWLGWALIAVGVRRLDVPVFWAVSVAWNALIGVPLIVYYVARDGVGLTFAHYYLCFHVVLALAGSVRGYALVTRSRAAVRQHAL